MVSEKHIFSRKMWLPSSDFIFRVTRFGLVVCILERVYTRSSVYNICHFGFAFPVRLGDVNLSYLPASMCRAGVSITEQLLWVDEACSEARISSRWRTNR